MGSIKYGLIESSGNDAVRELADRVDEVSDVTRLKPWKFYRERDGRISYAYNNTDVNHRPPLKLTIVDDAEIILVTTAYGDTELNGQYHRLARKATARDESALEWVQEHFELEGGPIGE